MVSPGHPAIASLEDGWRIKDEWYISRNLNEEKMHAFGEALVNDLGSMMLGSLAYIGDQLDLFKTLAEKSPMTTDQLANARCTKRRDADFLARPRSHVALPI